MGTYYTRNATKQDIIDGLLADFVIPGCLNIAEHTVIGDKLWLAVEPAEGAHPKTFGYIMLFLLMENPGYGWGYKPISEDMGPCYYDCPKHWLDMIPDPKTGYSTSWREKVRAA